MSGRLLHYMGHVPGWQFAEDIYATDERDARAQLRESAGCRRLPSGSDVWLYTPLPGIGDTSRDSPYSAASGM